MNGTTNPDGNNEEKAPDSGKKPAEAEGVRFTADTGQSKPPLEGAPVDEKVPGEEGAGDEKVDDSDKSPKEAVPITEDFIEITLGSVGTIAFQFTGYAPFQFTRQELQTIANLAAACEIKAPAQVQLIIGIVTLFGAKVGGYVLWKRAGKPPIHYDPDGNMIVGKQEPPEAAAGVPVK